MKLEALKEELISNKLFYEQEWEKVKKSAKQVTLPSEDTTPQRKLIPHEMNKWVGKELASRLAEERSLSHGKYFEDKSCPIKKEVEDTADGTSSTSSNEQYESAEDFGEMFTAQDSLAEENLIEEDITLDIEVKEELLTEHSCNTDAKVSFLGKALVHSTRLT